MQESWKKAFLAHSQSDRYRQVVLEAQRIIEQGFRLYNPYLAWSAGKDSTCMLHLVVQQNPDILVYHLDYGPALIPREVHQEIVALASKLNIRNFRIEAPEYYQKFGRQAEGLGPLFNEIIPKFQAEGYDATFVGLRSEESVKRKVRIKKDRSLSPLKEFWPVKSFTWMDIWAYIVSNQVPYLSHYDRYAPIVGWDKARFTTFFDPEFDKYGTSNVDGVLMWKDKNKNV